MIGIFDSGVGGLSVLNEVKKLIPSENLLYCADTLHLPYGAKSEEFLRKRSLQIAEFLKAEGAEIIVIACNTATAAAAELIRDKIGIPVVAVEPAIKPAVAISVSKVIGAIATDITLASSRFSALLERYAVDVEVIKRPSNDLVSLVENCGWKEAKGRSLLSIVADDFVKSGVDAVVLGSTHFTYLKESLIELSNGVLIPIGSAEATAQQVLKVFTNLDLKTRNVNGEVTIFVSGDADLFRNNLAHFSVHPANVVAKLLA